MSFQSKGFWMSKDTGCLIDGDITYDNTSRIEPKRLHQWFMDGSETELFPSKKQAVEVPSSNSFGGISSSTLSPWGNVPNFQSLPNQFGERLFDTDRNIASVNARNLEMGRKVMDDPFGNSSFDLSISHSLVDPKTCINYGGPRKVKVGEVRDSDNLMSMSMEASVGSSFAREDNNVIPTTHNYGKVDDSGISMGLTYGREEDAIITIDDPYDREDDNFVSLDQSFNKDDVDEISIGCNYKASSNTVSLTNSFGDGENILSMAKNCRGGEIFKGDGGKSLVSMGNNNIISMGTLSKGDYHVVSMSQTYDGGESLISMGNNYGKGGDVNRTASIAQSNSKGKFHSSSMVHSFDKGARNVISFSGCDNDGVSERLLSSYDFVMSQTPIPRANTLNHKDLVVSDTDALINTAHDIVSVANPVSEKKDDSKSKKTPPNNFPSNVRSLLSTGILDEVPVKYIAWSREKELRGVIKGLGYLCGCQSCNFSKVINAYELERHAGCKTKHPNNHIYFENGKTIYGIVQELRSTPQNMLFDVIQTITGSPINQKSFRLWKESFLAATRELQRIYGKDERHQPTGSSLS